MFDNIPIEKRWKLILGLIGFVFLVSLFYGRQVMGIYDKIGDLEAKTAVVENADLEIVNRQVRLKQLSEDIRRLQDIGLRITTQVEFLDYLDRACAEREIRLVSLPRESIEEIQGYRISAMEFSVEGMFHDILDLLNRMEARDRIGSVSHVNMELRTIRMRDHREEMLVARIRIKRLIDEKNT